MKDIITGRTIKGKITEEYKKKNPDRFKMDLEMNEIGDEEC